MAKVRLSTQAKLDFADIVSTLVQSAGKRVAKNMARQIRARIKGLQNYPGSGSPRPDYGPQTRVAIVPPFLVFYDGDHDSKVVEVLRILHGHRDITPRQIGRGRQ